MNKLLTVILPAAGAGSRLSLPYPKELMKINESHSLIDYTFDLFDEKNKNVQFVVILNEKKLSLMKYLSKYSEKFNISFVFQKRKYPEITGAIKSTTFLFTKYNLVLLPDTIMQLHRRKYISIDGIINSLGKTGFSFLFKREESKLKLRQMGCIKIQNNRCLLYEDKPKKNISRFNAFWAGFAFNRNSFSESIKIIEKSTLNKIITKKHFEDSPIYKSEGIEIDNQIDLGTWNRLRKKFLKDYFINHGIDDDIIN